MGKIRLNQATEYSKQVREKHFPWITALFYIALWLIAPFVSPYCMYISLIVQLYRLIQYGETVGYIDLAFTIPFSAFYNVPGGDALIVYYVLLFDIYLLLKKKSHYFNSVFGILLIVSAFLFLRFGNKITTIIFIVGGLLLLYLTFADGKVKSPTRTLYAFVSGTVLSSLYAYLFKSSAAVLAYTYNAELVEDGRFRGLFADPNYYSTFLILAIISLIILHMNRKVRPIVFYACFTFIGFMGALTVSKSFFLMFAFILLFYVISWFSQKQILKALIGVPVICCLIMFLVQGRFPVFNDVLLRFAEAENMSDMTTGRTDLWIVYLEYICNNIFVLFIGDGLDKILPVGGTHNLFIEIVYNIGILGLVLLTAFFFYVIRTLGMNCQLKKHLPIIRFLPMICVAMLYFFLQGFASTIFYLSLFVVFLCYIESIQAVNEE